MAEIGIQVWQGTLPENDIPALQQHLNGRLTLMGGFGAAIDRADAQPEEILAYARDTLRRCCPRALYPQHHLRSAGNGVQHVDQYLDQAVDEYNAPACPGGHSSAGAAPRSAESAKAVPQCRKRRRRASRLTSWGRISAALEQGQQKKLLALCDEALGEGCAPAAILPTGSFRA